MSDYNEIILPSKPKIIQEKDFSGVYEIDGLYPGYGHTLGNSLRRIILLSLSGAAITSVKIDGVSHEFSSINGVKEDVINILLAIKNIRVKMLTREPQTLNLKIKGIKDVTAGDIDAPGQVEVLNKDLHIASITDKNTELSIEMRVEKGLGYVPKEVLQKDRVDIGSIALDASFTPIRRVNYEVENMRVGDRTDFNRLRIFVETDGTISPKEALESSIGIMIAQLKAIVGFEEEIKEKLEKEKTDTEEKTSEESKEADVEFLKTRIESVDMSARTIKVLTAANIRTVGGLSRKKEKDLFEVEGLGAKGMQEIKKVLSNFGITIKQ